MHLRIASYGVFLMVALATSGEACAAFIALEFGPGRAGGTSFSVAEEPESSSIEDRTQFLETPDRPGVPGSRFHSRTGRGMSSNSTSVPVGPGAAGIALPVTEAQLTGGRLVTGWEREGGCELPTPHLEGVFRPPR